MWLLVGLALALGVGVFVCMQLYAFGRIAATRNGFLIWTIGESTILFVAGWAGGPISFERFAIAGVVVAGLNFLLARRRRWLLQVRAGLRDPRTHDASFHRLMAYASEKLGPGGSQVLSASYLIIAISILVEAGLLEAANSLLEKLPIERLSSKSQREALQNLALVRLLLGDVRGARGALERISDVQKNWLTMPPLLLLDGLVLAYEGDGVKSLSRVDDAIARGIPRNYELDVIHVRANAKAALGDDGGARAELRAYKELRGIDSLRALAQMHGPARDIARVLVEEYRVAAEASREPS